AERWTEGFHCGVTLIPGLHLERQASGRFAQRSGRMKRLIPIFTSVAALLLAGCMVGPQYKRPAAITAPAFKEAPPPQTAANDGWKPGQPGDQKLKGDWWRMYQDPQLDALEAQVDPAN